MHLIVNCPRNSKIAFKFKLAQQFKLLIKTILLTLLIYNLKTGWASKISVSFLNSLDHLPKKRKKKKIWQFWNSMQNNANFWLGVQYPLMESQLGLFVCLFVCLFWFCLFVFEVFFFVCLFVCLFFSKAIVYCYLEFKLHYFTNPKIELKNNSSL